MRARGGLDASGQWRVLEGGRENVGGALGMVRPGIGSWVNGSAHGNRTRDKRSKLVGMGGESVFPKIL